MSNLKDRAAARLASTRPPVPPLVPAHIRALYDEALAGIPHARAVTARGAARASGRGEALPAVGSFFA